MKSLKFGNFRNMDISEYTLLVKSLERFKTFGTRTKYEEKTQKNSLLEFQEESVTKFLEVLLQESLEFVFD